ncbi:MAG TPA: TonB-dependent receptor [Gemmatimonadaceae bacterium]|nr:TonB-dependent receptor [Gemmatimonadaceae bacterium]
MTSRPSRAAVRLAALLLAAAPPALGAQPPDGVVAGRVVAAATGAPLADVTVRVEGTTRGALSDAEGRFRIGAVPAGAHTLVAQRAGRGTLRQAVTVPAGDSVLVTLRLAEQAVVLAPTVVSATRERQRRAESSATIDVLDGAELRAARPSHPADVMNRLAGVHVSVLSGEGHSLAIRQPITTKPVYLYLEDGVPTRSTGFFNHNALYEVNLPQAAGVEVLKGPGTALYGSDAIGGVVNVLTRPAPATPSAEVSVEGGAFGYERLLASGGFTRGQHGLRADLNLTHSDNWKDDAPFTRRSGTLRWDHFTADGLTMRTVVTGTDVHQQDVPALSPAQFDATPALNRAPIAFRTVQALRASGAVELERGRTLWSVTPYVRYDVLDLLPQWQLSYDPQVWDMENSSVGLLARVRHDVEPLRARVVAGADVDYSPGSFMARQAVTTATGAERIYASYTPGETHYDYDVTYRQLSPYAQLQLSPTPRLRVDAGLRYDVSGYVYDNHLTPLATGAHRRPASTTVHYRHLSPKLGLTYDVGRGTSLFASYRHGFRAPSQNQLFQQNSAEHTVDLKPVRVDSYEVGVRGQLGVRAVFQLSAYDMRIADDILTFVTAEDQRVATNAGETRHRGVEGSLGLAVTPQLRLDASWSVASQRYTSWTPQAAQPASGDTPPRPAVDYSGNRIEAAPRDLGSVLLTYTAPLLRGGRLTLEWSHTGRYAMDPGNTHGYGGHELLDASVSVMVPRYDVELFARGVNLLGRRYAELAAWDPFQQTQLTPGTPRALYAGVKYTWSR